MSRRATLCLCAFLLPSSLSLRPAPVWNPGASAAGGRRRGTTGPPPPRDAAYAAAAAPDFGDDDGGARRLEDWLASRGVDPAGCRVATFPGGRPRGLASARDARAGSVLLRVPLASCLLTSDFNGTAFKGAAASSRAGGLPKKVQLALQALAHGRDPSSPFGPFLASWPDGVPSLLEDLPREELAREARSASLVREADEHRRWVRKQCKAAREADPSSTLQFSPEEFARALQLTGSRSLSVDLPSGVRGSALVPLLDMANHDPDPAASYRFAGDAGGGGSVELVARRDLTEGEEVTISYRAYPNAVLAKCYGFVPEINPHDYERASLAEVLRAAAEAGALEASEGTLLEMEAAAAALGFDAEGGRVLATGPEEGLWLAARAALADDDAYEELAEVLEAIDMDEADDEDLWEMDCDADVAGRAEVLMAAFGVLARRASSEGGDVLRGGDRPDSVRLLAELRYGRERLLRSAAGRMAEVVARPEGARDILFPH